MRYVIKTACSLGLAWILMFPSTDLLAWETPVPAKVRRYVERIFEKYDKDLDGVLAPDEWLDMHGYPILIAGSVEETITKERLLDYLVAYGHRRRIRLLFSPMKLDSFAPTLLHPSEAGSHDASSMTNHSANHNANHPQQKASGGGKRFYVPVGHLPGGLPSWFFTRDTNGDGQLSLPEFAVDGTQSSMSEFDKLDTNDDGVLSPRDLVKSVPKKRAVKELVSKEPAVREPVPKESSSPKPATENPIPKKPKANVGPDVKNPEKVLKPSKNLGKVKRGPKRKRKRKESTDAAKESTDAA